MRRPSLLALVAVALGIELSAQQSQSHADPRNSAAAEQTQGPDCDVHHVSLDLRFDWEKKQAIGVADLTLSVHQPSDSITLDAGLLSIQSVTDREGVPLDFEYDEGKVQDSLQVELGRVPAPDEIFQVQVRYRTLHINRADPNNIWGSFGKGLRFQGPTSTTPIKRRQVWTPGGPLSTPYWFPGNDSPGDLRTTDFTVTIARPLTVVSNGTLDSIKENSDGTRSFHYVADTPYANHLTSLAVGDYLPVKQTWDDIELVTYGYPDEVKAVKATVVRLPEMVEFLSEQTGCRYPFSTYSQVVVQDYPFPGRVNQHMAPIMSDNMIDDFRTHADFLYLWDAVEAQALAGQWFGSLLAISDFQHSWLNQGFARRFAGLFSVLKNGEQEYLTFNIVNDMSVTLADWHAGVRRPIVTPLLEDPEQYTTDNYGGVRGSLVLRMLQAELGEKAWRQVLQHYVKRHSGGVVSTGDLQQAVEDITGDSLSWFFDQWVYGMGHPVLEVRQEFDAEARALTLTLSQTQETGESSAYTQPAFFRGSMQIALDDTVVRVDLKPQSVNTFTFPVETEPKSVRVDPRGIWIKEIDFPKGVEALLHQLTRDHDALGQRTAMMDLARTAMDADCAETTRAKIRSAILRVITSGSYWRIRMFAVGTLQSLLDPASSGERIQMDEATVAALILAVQDDAAWLRAAAIGLLGLSRDPRFVSTYVDALEDDSDRVINAAATALGATGSPRAFDLLVALKDKPSWKSQSLISALNGLRELGDPRGYAVALEALSNTHLPRWWLASPTWDYPIAAVQTINALGQNAAAFPVVDARFRQSLKEDDWNDIFSNLLLIADLGDPRGQGAFDLLRDRFEGDSNAMEAIQQYANRFHNAMEAAQTKEETR